MGFPYIKYHKLSGGSSEQKYGKEEYQQGSSIIIKFKRMFL